MRKSVKFAVVLSATVAIVGTGVAFAAWNATGSGSAYTKATSAQALSTVDVSAQAAGQLYPGGTGDVIVKLHNPNPYPVLITSIAGNGPITASGGLGTCTTTGVTFTSQAGSWDVAANSDAQFTLTGAAHMSNASDDGCQGALFTIPVTLSGSSNPS
jgi:hypothetical protein